MTISIKRKESKPDHMKEQIVKATRTAILRNGNYAAALYDQENTAHSFCLISTFHFKITGFTTERQAIDACIERLRNAH